MDAATLEHNYQHHAPTGTKIAEHVEVRGRAKELAQFLNVHLPEGCEKALAMTKLEEVMFWANAAIARRKED